MSSHSTLEQELEIVLNVEQSQQLADLLAASFAENFELRVDLPKNWAIFWKIRSDESRVLLAHPQEGEWVATAALESSHAKLLTDHLSSAVSGTTFSLGEIGIVGGVSNVDIRVRIA